MFAAGWEKVLWKKQPFPDNYTPDSFLSALKRNSNFRPYYFWPLVLASSTIIQHIASIFVFLVAFVRLQDGTWDPRLLVYFSVGLFLAGYLVWEVMGCFILGYGMDKEMRAKVLKSSILLFLALLALSPVLRSLSASTSSDSIWALSACLFILNILLADYTPPTNPQLNKERLTAVLSVNAGMSASVLLASRLIDDISVFGLMAFSIQLLALFPILRTRMSLLPASLRSATTISCVAISLYLTLDVSPLVAGIEFAFLTFVAFGAPAVLVWAQKFKNEIRGPWDVAVPQVR